MKKLIFAILAVFLLTLPVLGANTVTTAPGKITIVPDGSTTYDSTSTYAQGLKVTAIKFYPSAVNDKLIVRHSTDTGTIVAKHISIDGGVTKEYFDGTVRLKPVIKETECTFTTPGSVLIIIEYEP